MAGTLSVQKIQGLATSATPTTVEMASGHALHVNTLKGTTTAGSINVQGEGTNTTNLQQGLQKQWIDFNGSGTVAIVDSFNSASISDEGTGDYRVNLTNAMRAQEGCINTGIGQNRDGGSPTDNDLFINFSSSSQILMKSRDSNQGSDEDSQMVCTSVNGDLA